MNALMRVKVLKYTVRLLKIVEVLMYLSSAFVFVEPLVLFVYSRGASVGYIWRAFWNLATMSIPLIIGGIILGRVGTHAEEVAGELIEGLKKEIVGTVYMYKEITLQELSRKMGMSPDETEKFLATLAMEGTFKGTIDRGVVIWRSLPETESEGESREGTVHVMDPLSKIRKLEELYREGKVDEITYRRLREEYEREIG